MIDLTSPSLPVTEYFSGLASIYADHRPTYPGEAIQWMLAGLPAAAQAADIGCGTGISTRLLAEQGAHAVGIDPNTAMLEQARRGSTPQHLPIEYRLGTGDRTGLADQSVDLILCAQSFHWLEPLAALREFHRIARPGGRLALIWNVKDASNPFSAGFTAIMNEAQADAERRGLRVPAERAADITLGGHFVHPQSRDFSNPQTLDLQGVFGRARSASYFPKSGEVRNRMEHDLHTIFDANQSDGRVTLHHRTEVTIADRA